MVPVAQTMKGEFLQRMKKAWFIIISIFLIILVGGGGTAYYLTKVKTYDIGDAEVEDLTENDYEIILPGQGDFFKEQTDRQLEDPNSTAAKDKEDTTIDPSLQGLGDDDNRVNPQKEDSNTRVDDKKGQPKNESLPTEITAEAITQKYTPSFEHLQSQATSKVDALVAHAYQEYQEKKKNGHSISIPYFYNKYSSASKELEKNTDQAFTMILDALQGDLKTNGFSASHADTLKEEYEAQKKAREEALLKKIKEAL